MSVQSEIARLISAKESIKQWLDSAGVSHPGSAQIDTLAALLPTITTVYVGSGKPNADLGADGDIYLDMG